MKFGALLYSKWEYGDKNTSIIGHWAEDNALYEITCPSQLRTMLVELQNILSTRYNEIIDMKCKLDIKLTTFSHFLHINES